MNSILQNANVSEYQYVLRLLESQWNPITKSELIEWLDKMEVNWGYFLQITKKEGVEPLVYFIIQGIDEFPPNVVKVLKDKYFANKARNIIIFDELIHGLENLNKKDIPVVLLKGVSLIGEIYQDYASRPMRDIDLLIQKKDVPEAVQIFQDLGFELNTIDKEIETFLEYENELLLVKPGFVNVMLELHWNLIDSPYYQQKLNLDWFWRGTKESRFFVNGLVFSFEAQLLHLSAHLSLHHGGNELLWLNDIAKIVSIGKGQVDWDELISRAKKYSLILPLKDSVRNLEKLLNVKFPNQFIKNLDITKASVEEQQNYYFLSSDKSVGDSFFYDLKNILGTNRKVKFLVKNVFPPFKYMQLRYHPPNVFLMPFYYPYRWYLGIKSLFN